MWGCGDVGMCGPGVERDDSETGAEERRRGDDPQAIAEVENREELFHGVATVKDARRLITRKDLKIFKKNNARTAKVC